MEIDLQTIRFFEGFEIGTESQQIAVLKEMMLALMMEVEALRSAMIEEAKSKGIAPKDSVYGQVYYETGLLTHSAAGPSSGTGKLINRFISTKITTNGIQLREGLMLFRLGYSPDEIAEYADDAEHYETQT